MVSKNLNFDNSGAKPHLGIINAAGKIPIGTGNTSPTPEILAGSITSPDSSLTIGYSSPNITIQANGSVVGETITGNTGGALSPVAGNWNIVGNNSTTNGFASFNTGSGNTLTVKSFGPAKWIVNPVVGIGTHQTVQSAINSAVSGETIFITPGTYTENVTLKAGVNLTAFDCDGLTPNVTIVGKCTFTAAGTVSISGIRLQTNSDNSLAVTGSAASIVNLDYCYLNCTNNTGISYTSSSSSSQINFTNCKGDLGTTGIGLFSHSSTGVLTVTRCTFGNSGGSTTSSTCSAGIFNANYMNLNFPVTFSGTGTCTWEHCAIATTAINTTCLTLGGGATSFKWCSFISGTASAISASSATNEFTYCSCSSSNANAITGSGTITYTPYTFNGSSSTVNTTTQTPNPIGPKIYSPGGISFDSTNYLASFVDWTSWTPTLVGQTTAGTSTYTTQQGLYCRIGNVAIVQFNVAVSAATGTGNINIGSLPFTINNTSNYTPMGSVMINSTGISFPASTTTIALRGILNTTTAALSACGSSTAESFIQMANTSIGVRGTLIYRI